MHMPKLYNSQRNSQSVFLELWGIESLPSRLLMRVTIEGLSGKLSIVEDSLLLKRKSRYEKK